MRSLARVLAPLLAAGCLAAPPVGEQQAPIIGGANDSGDPAVVLVVIQGGSLGGALCTGEVVSPHVVLTAAHCVSPARVGSTAKFRVFLGNAIGFNSPPSQFVDAKETHVHPDYVPGQEGLGADVAIVVTAQPLPPAPLPMNRTPLDATFQGKPVRFVGFGVSSGTDTMGQSAGVKRETNSKLGTVMDVLLQFNDASHSTCEGDSGGPAFMKVDGTNEVIIGLTSFGINPNCAPPGFDTRIDVYTSFVDPFILANDPPPPPDMALAPGQDFQPGAIGSTCGGNNDCDPGLVCAQPGPNGFCTQGCDPTQMGQCPPKTHCGDFSGENLCLKDKGSGGGGCSLGDGGGTPVGGALLAAGALLLIARRRRSRFQ